MSLFTPVQGLIGGSLVGAAAGTLLLFNGDIMGYSGIFTSIFLHPIKTFNEAPWKLTFLASFSWAATVYMRYIDPNCLNTTSGEVILPSTLAFALGGFLVGFGTKLGNGCTSGHGISGLARYSKRSFVNVLSFMTTGILTSIYMSTALDDDNPLRTTTPSIINSSYGMLFTVASILAALPNLSDAKTMGASLSAVLGCIGLALSGMIQSRKISNFLNISALWKNPSAYDPTLACVMGSGVVVSWLSYQYKKTKNMTKPLEGDEFHVPTNTTIDWKLVLGGSLFGIGWAIGCYCPGPALFNVAVGQEGAMLYWMPCFIGGAFLAQCVIELSNKKKSKTT